MTLTTKQLTDEVDTLRGVALLLITAMNNAVSLNSEQRAALHHAQALLDAAPLADDDVAATERAVELATVTSASARESLLVARANAAAQAPQDELDAPSAPPPGTEQPLDETSSSSDAPPVVSNESSVPVAAPDDNSGGTLPAE